MTNKQWTIWVVLGIMSLLIAGGPALAQGIKERMSQRLPLIAELKKQGIVGENNRGYLEFVGSVRNHEALVDQENQDRKTVYTHIAAQQNTSIAVVEKNRAVQLAERAAPGTYVQNMDGTWVKK